MDYSDGGAGGWTSSSSPFMLPFWSVFGAVDLEVIEERLPYFSFLMVRPPPPALFIACRFEYISSIRMST